MEGGIVLIPRMIQHAVGIFNRYRVGKDGRAAYPRVKGRQFNQGMAEFGEGIWYLKPKFVGKYKDDVR